MAELLSPAGGMESALAAIKAGADALYIGGKSFSARSNAQNFSEEEIESLIVHAALVGVRIYIAVNTLYKDAELPQVIDFVVRMHNYGAAAFILQDAGLAYILKSKLPQVEIHASTQMTIHSTAGARRMRDMGFSRVVLARELSLADISEIVQGSDIGCEVFIHGALCVAYSGQCLMSSMIGGRSGNRGKCAQICRTAYSLQRHEASVANGYLLSPKDICTLDILDDIISSGVTSLKIEGRMKNAEYVYAVTKAYRQQLDKITSGDLSHAEQTTKQDVLQVFNRGGSFSTGYYHANASDNTSNMMSTHTPKSTGVKVGEVVAYNGRRCKIQFHAPLVPGDGIEVWGTDGHVGTSISKTIGSGDVVDIAITGCISSGNAVYKSFDKNLKDRLRNEMAAIVRTVPVQASVVATCGKPLALSLASGGCSITAYGNIVARALQAPMKEADIVAQLSKMGGTPFTPQFTHVEVDSHIFVAKAELNHLRRDAVAMLENAIAKAFRPPQLQYSLAMPPVISLPPLQDIAVHLSNAKHLSLVAKLGVRKVYIPYDNLPEETHGTMLFATLPRISDNSAIARLAKVLPMLEASPKINGYLVRTYGQLELLKNSKKHIVLDNSFNIFNTHAALAFTNATITVSQELNAQEIKAMQATNLEVAVYGRQLLMCLQNCPVGMYASCHGRKSYKEKDTHAYALKDKRGFTFPIVTDCKNCITYVYNSAVQDAVLKLGALKGVQWLRLVFTTEDSQEIQETILRYNAALVGEKNAQPIAGATAGHLSRGVE